MSTWLVVWLVVGLVTTAALIVVLVGLVRHVMILGRAAREMQEAVGPVTGEIAAESQRASTRLERLAVPGKAGRSSRTRR